MTASRGRWLPGPARALLAWLDEHDPGGVDRMRARHFVVAVTLAILAARFADAAFGLGEPVRLPLFAGLAAGTLLFLLVPSRRRDEAVAMGRSAAVLVGYLLMVALIGETGHTFGIAALTALLVPLTFVALYVRRYGVTAKSDGIALFEIALVVATTAPTASEALLFALTTAGGAIIAMTVRLALYRPIAVPAFERAVVDYRRAAADALTGLGDAVAGGAPWPADRLAHAAYERRRLRAAAVAAVREAPSLEPAVQKAKSATYKLEIASGLVGERLAEAISAGVVDSGSRRAVAAALAAAAAAVRPGGPAQASASCDAAVAAARAALLRASIDLNARDRMLVALAGIARIGIVAGSLDGQAPSNGPAEPTGPATGGSGRGLLQTTRVAIQGLCATLVTTTIYLAFDLDHGYWATLTVAFVLGSSFGETVARVRTRLAGTAVGVALGLGAALTIGDHVPLVAALAVVSLALSLITMRDRYDVSSACVAFSVLIGLHLISGLGVAGMIARLYDTAIGAAAALLCARFVLPVALADPTRAEISAYLVRCRAVFARLWPGGAEADAAPVADTPATLATAAFVLRDRLPRLNDETALGFRSTGDVVRLVTQMETIASYLTLIDGVAARLSTLPRAPDAAAAIDEARNRVLAAFDAASGTTAILRPSDEVIQPHTSDRGLGTGDDKDGAVIGMVEYSYFADALERALTDVRAELPPAPPPRQDAAPTAPRRLAGVLAVIAAAVLLVWQAPAATAAQAAKPAASVPTWDWIIGADKLPSPPPKVGFLGLDGFDTPKKYVTRAEKRGTRTWCYLSVGTLENWRPDRKAFEALNEKRIKKGRKPFIGKRYPEWEGERWLDVRLYKAFLPLMVDRLEMCRDKGFEFVEFDNLDAYENETGFKISKSDTIRYAKALAKKARALGLKPMQKNVPQLARTLEPYFDAILFEDCALYKFCGNARPFIKAGKPAFDADYPEGWKDEGKTFDKKNACAQAKDAGVSMIFKRLDLDEWVRRCD